MKQDRITNREAAGRDMVIANDRVMASGKWAKPSAPPAPPKNVATNIKRGSK